MNLSRAVILAGLLFTPSVACAHGMLVIPTVHPKGVTVEVKYDDGTPAVGATVRILSPAGDELSKGVTDEKGIVELPRPAVIKGCKARAEDGMGHASSTRLPVPEDEQATATAKVEPNRFWTTVGGLAIIALIGLLLRRFWPKPPPLPPAIEKSSDPP